MKIFENLKASELISSIPVIGVLLYILGFLTVNLYFNNLGIENIEPLNLSYLIIGFFDLCVILLPFTPLLLCYIDGHDQFTPAGKLGKDLLIYTTTFFSLLSFELNSFFYYQLTGIANAFVAIGITYIILIHFVKKKPLLYLSLLFSIATISLAIYSFSNSSGIVKIFIKENVTGLLIGFVFILFKFRNNISNLPIEKYLSISIFIVLFILHSSYTIFINKNFISSLKISIGGLKPTRAQIFLKEDCLFNSKDSLSLEFKLDHSLPILLLYNSTERVIVSQDSSVVSLETKCIKSIKTVVK